MKRCSKCQQDKPLSEFYRKKNSHQGWCKKCAIINRIEYYRKNRKNETDRNKVYRQKVVNWLKELKAHPCTDCGIQFHHAAMQWDHIPGEPKSANISNMVDHAKSRILAELDKCELVCANCHAIRTFERRQHSPQSVTNSTRTS